MADFGGFSRFFTDFGGFWRFLEVVRARFLEVFRYSQPIQSGPVFKCIIGRVFRCIHDLIMIDLYILFKY